MENKACKKCKRPLPSDSKHLLCENCRGKVIEKGKKGIAGIGTAVISLGTIIVKIASEVDNNNNHTTN